MRSRSSLAPGPDKRALRDSETANFGGKAWHFLLASACLGCTVLWLFECRYSTSCLPVCPSAPCRRTSHYYYYYYYYYDHYYCVLRNLHPVPVGILHLANPHPPAYVSHVFCIRPPWETRCISSTLFGSAAPAPSPPLKPNHSSALDITTTND